MARRIEIVGTDKVWIIKKCIECPLLDSDAMCIIDNKHRPKFDEECENCPLPDATEAPADVWPDDENHRLGPNGELLTAVTAYIDPEYSFESCKKCLYVNIPKLKCSLPVSERLCSPTSRKDKARIHWEVAGDRT